MNSKKSNDEPKERSPIGRTTERFQMLQRSSPEKESFMMMDYDIPKLSSFTNDVDQAKKSKQGLSVDDLPVDPSILTHDIGAQQERLLVEPYIALHKYAIPQRNEDASSDEDCESQKQKVAAIESKFYTVHDYHDHAWEPYAFHPTGKMSIAPAATDGGLQFLRYGTNAQHEYTKSDIAHRSSPALSVANSSSAPNAEMDIPGYFLELYAASRRRRNRSVNEHGDSHASSGDPDKNTFPKRLYTMLKMSETEDEQRSIVSWQPHGRCFLVHKPQEFVEFILPKYFRQTKFTSFQRQLNLYGFTRLTTGTDRGAYYHEFFVRGRPFLCTRIVRIRVKGNGVKPAPSPDTEPDFYRMKPCFEYDIPPAFPESFESMRSHPQHLRESQMAGNASTTGNILSGQHRGAAHVLDSLYQINRLQQDMAGATREVEALIDPSLAMQYSFLPPNVLLAAAATNAQDHRREKPVPVYASSKHHDEDEDKLVDLFRDSSSTASFGSPTLHANQPSSSLRRSQSDDFVQKKRCANTDYLVPQPNSCLDVVAQQQRQQQQDASTTLTFSKPRSVQDAINRGRPPVGVKRYRSDSSVTKERDGLVSEENDFWEKGDAMSSSGKAEPSEPHHDEHDLFNYDESERRDGELDTEIIRMLARGAHMM